VVLIYVYLKHRKKPLFFWSLAWVFFILMQVAICVIGEEGASVEALLASDVVVKDVKDAINLLLNEKRLIATLRG